MTERQEIIGMIEQAIRAHQRNMAHAELGKAQSGSNSSVEFENTISHARGEIERLQGLKDRIGNNNGRVTQKERLDKISIQLSEVQGQVTSVNHTLENHSAILSGIKATIDTIEVECPLFRADMEEGQMIFVKKSADDNPSMGQ